MARDGSFSEKGEPWGFTPHLHCDKLKGLGLVNCQRQSLWGFCPICIWGDAGAVEQAYLESM